MSDLNFAQIFSELSYTNLLACKKQLDEAILESKRKHREVSIAQDIKDFVDLPLPLLLQGSVNEAEVMADVVSLNLAGKSKSNETSTQWLTNTGEAYVWQTSSGSPVVKTPQPIEDYRGISGVMDFLNSDLGLRLNSCLVSCLKSGSSNLRLHNDNEESMDSSQPIVVVTLGAKRKVDFFGVYQRTTEAPALSISPESGSAYVILSTAFLQTDRSGMLDTACHSVVWPQFPIKHL